MSTRPHAFLDGQFLEGRIEADFQGPLAKQPRAERVDRAHEDTVDPVQRGGEPLAVERIVFSCPLPDAFLEVYLEALAQLGGRLARERHRGDLVDRRDARSHQGHHTRDEFRGLARTGPGLHQEIGAEVVADARPRARPGKGG